MGQRRPPQNWHYVLTAGDPTASSPPFPLLPLPAVLSADVGASRDFMAPHTCGGSLLRQAEPRTCVGSPCGCPDLELRQGLVVHLRCYVRCCGATAVAERAARSSGPCLTLGLSSASLTDLSRQRRQRYPPLPRMSSLRRPDFLGPCAGFSARADGRRRCASGGGEVSGGREFTGDRVRKRCAGHPVGLAERLVADDRHPRLAQLLDYRIRQSNNWTTVIGHNVRTS